MCAVEEELLNFLYELLQNDLIFPILIWEQALLYVLKLFIDTENGITWSQLCRSGKHQITNDSLLGNTCAAKDWHGKKKRASKRK